MLKREVTLLRWSSRGMARRVPRTQYNMSQDPPGGSARNRYLEQAMCSRIFTEPTIVVRREIEMMNLFLGYEQVNRYTVCDVQGNELGTVGEPDALSARGLANTVARQLLRTRRPFELEIWDTASFGSPEPVRLGAVGRGLKWLNSHVQCSIGPDHRAGVIAGESKQVWAPLRRKYDLYSAPESRSTKEGGGGTQELYQFGHVDTPFLGWEFRVHDRSGRTVAGCDRSFGGFGREIFTDAGVYILRMDAQQSFTGIESPEQMNYAKILSFHERCAMLANCISIDFDYFSRHSGSGGLVSTSSYE